MKIIVSTMCEFLKLCDQYKDCSINFAHGAAICGNVTIVLQRSTTARPKGQCLTE